MIYPAHMEGEIIKFCEIAGIPLVRGIVPSEHVRKVENFVLSKMKQDRLRTKRFEETNRFHIGNIFNNAIRGLNFESPIEEYMATALIKHGLMQHCRIQFEIGTKRVDFAFPLAHLAVECDGMEYHFLEQEQIEKDQKRDVYLAKKGWRVLHIEGLAIRRNIDLCIEKIKGELRPFLGNL